MNNRVAIITGIPPISVAEAGDLGISSAILPKIFKLLGREKFHFSGPTIGPAALAAYLRQYGVDVDIIDYYTDKAYFRDYSIVGISSSFIMSKEIKEITRDVRGQNPLASIVVGGPYAWMSSSWDLMEGNSDIDYVVLQEGEETFLQLIKAIREHASPSKISNIMYRGYDNKPIYASTSQSHLNIEYLPYPAWELMDVKAPKKLPVLFVETSRGCPYDCNYCSECTYWGKPVRYRTEQRVANEIYYNAYKFGITTFRFTDSCFSAPPLRCANVCSAITTQCVNNSIPVKWSAYSRIENFSFELMSKMKRSGCVALDIGLESGSKEILSRMNKLYDPEIAIEVARWARHLGIIINYNILIGFPGETWKTVEQSANLIRRAAPDTYACLRFNLRPNSFIYDNQQSFGIQKTASSWKHETMTGEEAEVAQMQLTKAVSTSLPLPGGEHITCYLSALGYSVDDIKRSFKAMMVLRHNPLNIGAFWTVKNVISKVASYT